jgi:GDP/UDP-N,N'-diacetylbacillosamine 2-epimerase (hydrolysing)
MKKKRILVTTGTRAEYGILRHFLNEIKKNSKIELILVVTGTHLSKKHGYTINEIKKDNFKINAKVKMIPKILDKKNLTKEIGKGIIQFSDIFSKFKPDINIVFGDRDEMLASAIAASHMNIINAHLAGGDKSGGIDEYNRHAITKLSNIHFTNTKTSKKRIIKMGENPKFVFNTGSLAIDNIKENISTKIDIEKKLKIKLKGDEIILIQHPVTTQLNLVEKQIENMLHSIVNLEKTTIIISSNADAKSNVIQKKITEFSKKYDLLNFYINLPRQDFLGLLKYCGVLVGNSSSGIVEASYFSIPVVNIGIRQLGRERGKKVIEVKDFNSKKIEKAIRNALKKENSHELMKNTAYGDGNASKRIVKILEKPLPKNLIQKYISY